MSNIHPTAIIADTAEIAEGTTVGPYTVIQGHVKIAKNNQIASHVVIEGHTEIGEGNRIFQFASVGAVPQDLKYEGEDSKLVIGDHNIIREGTTLQPGTKSGQMMTKIGNRNLFMTNTHIAHDVTLGDNNIFVNNCAVAGHITIGNHNILSAHTAFHQFITIGDYSIVSGGSITTKDIPPFCMVQGDRSALVGINKIGLERNGFSKEEIARITKLYRYIFLSEGLTEEKISKAEEEYKDCKHCLHFINFLKNSKRGYVTARKK